MEPSTRATVGIDTLLAMFRKYWLQGRHDRSLDIADMALSRHPDSVELFWYRCCCLEKQDLHQQALDEIAAKQQAEQEKRDARHEQPGDESVYDEIRDPVLNDFPLFLVTLDGMSADLCKAMLHWLGNERKRLSLYDRLIALEPGSAEHYADRSLLLLLHAALDTPEGEGSQEASADVVLDYSGIAHSRPILKKALRDSGKAAELSPEVYRYPLQSARVLHLLKRYDEALAAYDRTLELMPADDPARPFIVERRKASENNGQGEYDQLADFIASGISDMVDDTKNRSTKDDMAYAVLKTVEEGVRSGRTMQQATEFLSDSPNADDLAALSIARNLMTMSSDQPMNPQPIDLNAFPDYQQKFLRQTGKQLDALGCEHVGDVELQTISEKMGMRVAIGLYLAPEKNACAALYTIKPKWPGLLGFLLAWLSGQWRQASVVEVSTQLDNGHFVLTRSMTVSDDFGAGPLIHIEDLSTKTPLKNLLEKHALRVREFTHVENADPVPIHSLEDIAQAMQQEQATRAEYRRSIGYVTREELKASLGKHYDRYAEKILEKIKFLSGAAEQRD